MIYGDKWNNSNILRSTGVTTENMFTAVSYVLTLYIDAFIAINGLSCLLRLNERKITFLVVSNCNNTLIVLESVS